MRCDNCGWENPDTNTRCEKCNSPLSAGPISVPQQPLNLNKTVSEAAAFSDLPSGNAQINVRCPRCGYPLRSAGEVCPNCGLGDVPQPAQAAPIHHHAPAQGTINPWVQVGTQVQCTLSPIAHEGELKEPQPQQFQGDCHALNRANLDAENMTITSKVQAELTCENGQWYIEDKSQQHTTFVRSAGKIALKDGDVILMGNRQFVFKAK